LLDKLTTLLYNWLVVITCGDKMINKINIEMFYDYFDEVANLLYENYKKSYIEGMNEAFNFLLDEKFEGEYNLDDIEKIKKFKTRVSEISFEREEIRKGVQLGLLKGYKHEYKSNELITPDTIGIFIGYLIEKLYKGKKLENILDPLMGSGNLVFTVLNHLKKKLKVFGIDNDLLKCKVARNISDLLEYENELFFQDTLTYYDSGFDLIVTDLPIEISDLEYFPYKVINHHLEGLIGGGFFFAVIENDFFEKQGNEIFKSEIDDKAYIYGLIKLNESLFKNNPKSILILQKKSKNVLKQKDFLMVELPSFNELDSLNNTIKQIDLWFEKREVD